ncbi:MAG: FAD-binding oxidoreductase [Methanobacteriota archaeon]|nr:MAG: FAD-binding oxidoreductase [Euryarchaeota archaeon]
MGLLRDWNYVERAVQIPALSEVIREALIRALFVRDDRVLPADLIGDLNRVPRVTVKVKDDGEVRKLVRVLNGEESTVSLGLNAEDYHYFRTQLGVGRTREFGLVPRPRALLTYDWIVPEQRGVQLDFSAYGAIEFAGDGHRAIAQVGATWKQLYDDALSKGHAVPFVPTVPLDFAVGDGLFGDAPFASFRGDFGTYVNGLRTISPYGHRARIGFEEVANNGTAYDLLHATLPLAAEFFVPVEVALRLEAKPANRKTLTYSFEDGPKLSAALDRLSRSGPGIGWVHVTDAVAAKTLRPAVPPEAFTVQLSLAATATGLAAREKAVDAAMAGFKSKGAETPSPFEVPAAAYRKTAEAVGRSVFVGEVRIPAKLLGDFIGKVRAFGDQSSARAGVYASLRDTGIASAFPSFAAPKDRDKVYDLSKGVRTIVSGTPGAAFTSRLAHLWEEEPGFLRRMALLRSLKLEIDAAHVVQPLIAP